MFLYLFFYTHHLAKMQLLDDAFNLIINILYKIPDWRIVVNWTNLDFLVICKGDLFFFRLNWRPIHLSACIYDRNQSATKIAHDPKGWLVMEWNGALFYFIPELLFPRDG